MSNIPDITFSVERGLVFVGVMVIIGILIYCVLRVSRNNKLNEELNL